MTAEEDISVVTKSSRVIDVSSLDEAEVGTAAKAKYKQPSKFSDPLQYHAKPKDLLKSASGQDQNVVDIAVSMVSTSATKINPSESHIFSRNQFSKLSVDEKLAVHLEKKVSEGGMGLTQATKVQSVVIPLLQKDRHNILMKSQTGSGKTLGYLIPIMNDLIVRKPPVNRSDGTYALIIAPTRELCTQISDVITRVLHCCVWIVGGSLTGGEKKKSEKARIRKGISILVATPGRLLDHMRNTESLTLKKLRWIVLDEADRLLDMGFEQSILEILSTIRGENLPGYEPSKQAKQKDDISIAGGSLSKRWSHHTSMQAKRSSHTSGICHILASATLSRSVKELAMPIMGGANMYVVDADKERVQLINDEADLENLWMDGDESKKRKPLTGNSDTGAIVTTSNGIVDFGDDTEVAAPLSSKSSKKQRLALDKDEVMEAPEQLVQYFMMVTCKLRLSAMLSFLRIHSNKKIVVFFSTCDAVDYHSLLVRDSDWPVDLDPAIDPDSKSNNSHRRNYLEPLPPKFTGILGSECTLFRLHGNMPQKLRHEVFSEFCAAKRGVLFCTDVAARGLDLPHIDWILQYDPPCETTDYVHRVGRTARRGCGGSALLFLLPSEASYINLLQSHSLNPQPLSLQSVFVEASKSIPGAIKFKNLDEMTAVIIQRRLETVVHDCQFLMSAARQAFHSFIRAYATHSNDTKSIFKVQSLHLGHVAKSFGLRETPAAMRAGEDILGRIMNGGCSYSTLGGKEAKKQARYDKYALSKTGDLGKISRRASLSPSASSGGGMKKGKGDRQKLRSMATSSSGNAGGGTAGANANAARPSGKFRKSDGYFRKKLRSQSNSEFSN